MAAIFSAVARFSAVDKFSSVLAKMEARNQRFAASSSVAFRKVEASANSLRGRIGALSGQFKALFAAASITTLLYSGATAIVDYDKAIASLQAITGVTTAEIQNYKKVIAATAKETRESSVDIAKAFELVGSAKPELLASADALGMVSKQAIYLSKAPGMNMESSVTALTNSLNQFGEGADKAAEFTDILATAQQKGSGNILYLSQAVVKSGGVMKAFGNNFEDTIAILEGFAKAGVPAAEAGTMLSGIMSKLSKVQNKDFNPQFTKATDIIDNLAKANLSYTDLMKMTDAEGAKWLTQIINQNGIVQELAGNLNDVGNAQSQAAINTASLSERFKQLSNSFQNAIIATTGGSTGMKMFGKIITIVADNLGWIISLIGGFLAVFIPAYLLMKVATGITYAYNFALAAQTIILGKGAMALKGNVIALKAYGSITKTITMLQWAWNAALTANPIGLIIVGVVALIAAIVMLVKHWDTIKAKFEAAPTWVKVAMMPFIMAVGPLLMIVNTIKKLANSWDGIKRAFSDGSFMDGIKKIGGVLLSALIDPLVFFLKMLAKIPGLGSTIDPLIEKIQGFQANAEGGFGVDEKLNNKEAINTAATQNAVQSEIIKESRQSVDINVNDPKEQLKVNRGTGPVPVKVNGTTGKF